MKRLFSPHRSGGSSPKLNENRSRSNSISNSNSNTNNPSPQATDQANLSPELAPIVTLLSAQAHRRYHEGVFMLLQSINSEGEPVPNRRWREVYGVLLGTQLAVWDIEELEKHHNDTEALINASSKPDYINFTDSSFRAVEKLENSQGLKNVIIVSTTLKNQYLLQYPEAEDFLHWNSAFRLATFEYTSLQEAYTGALLSSKGSKLSDIRTILADTKFDYEDWVSVRFGSGMPWKRCYAVIEQPSKKSKGNKIYKGHVSFYKDEKKQKKTAMAIIKDASATYALYPNAIKMIDHSTMIKLEGTVFFDSSKKSLPKEASVYFMPEQHSAVPGYDTLIRFLIPLLNTFALYGRPKRLNANKTDLNSLLFGLPVLPHVHYLEVDDLVLLSNNPQSANWLVTDWRTKIKEVLERKLTNGYTGCGSTHGVVGAINSPAINSNEFLGVGGGISNRPLSPLSPSFLPQPKFRDSTISKSSSLNVDSTGEESLPGSPPKINNRNSAISQIYEDYSGISQKQPKVISSSTESFSRQPPRQVNDFDKPFTPPQSQRRAFESQESLQQSIPSSSSQRFEKPQKADPYSNFRDTNNSDLDEDFDDDEIFQRGVSALSVKETQPSIKSTDPFTPDYGRATNEEPKLALQSKSKPLPTPAIKVDHISSPYTSGRISQLSPDQATFGSPLPSNARDHVAPPTPQHVTQPKTAQQQFSQQEQPVRQNQEFDRTPIPRSQAQKFVPPASQAPSNGYPQQQGQQAPYPQESGPNNQRTLPTHPQPTQPYYAQAPTQGSSSSHRQYDQPPQPQQQQQQQIPPQQYGAPSQQQQFSNRPPQQRKVPAQQYPPQDSTNYSRHQQQPHPVANGPALSAQQRAYQQPQPQVQQQAQYPPQGPPAQQHRPQQAPQQHRPQQPPHQQQHHQQPPAQHYAPQGAAQQRPIQGQQPPPQQYKGQYGYAPKQAPISSQKQHYPEQHPQGGAPPPQQQHQQPRNFPPNGAIGQGGYPSAKPHTQPQPSNPYLQSQPAFTQNPYGR